ncbi:MAG: hypothetical protein OZSIB_2933 [Candidatus Ozemobacter sibiricus]|jgi:hypothetical protein|uniref:Uncharacterized protein n=1 Tax=Candidatus Ozemobacter sibiricus TaxID=2268124 RepID=A0A367ZRF2_9BACT|nr:MAG: hypothetical protein OZSIB_2933 [Candidatus Ozemobacter sibiricus]
MHSRALLATLSFLLVVGLYLPLGAPAAQEAIPGYPFLPLTAANVRAFSRQVEAEAKAMTAFLEQKYGDDRDKIERNPELTAYRKLLHDLQEIGARLAKGETGDDLARAFTRAQRLHYAIKASGEDAPTEPRWKRRLAMGTNIALGPLLLQVPNVYFPPMRLGARGAAKEAARLYRPEKPGVPVTREELAEMTALEVSRLQPAPDHPALAPEPPGDRFGAFLAEQTRLIQALGKKTRTFDFAYARRILYYDELKEDATSPKITAKDRYGQKWKVKWGDEVHTDVALTRLYIDLGGTCTDLKFYAGPGETILILDPPGKKAGGIRTWADLAAALLRSKFQFHADRYLLPAPVLKAPDGTILGTGQVDAAMIERESLDPKYLGAYFVKFKEAQLSFYNPALRRLGGAALGNVGAVEDRVARGSLVFNAWIKNKDMKDDNSRVGLLFNPDTGSFDRCVEFQSDLGCSLGSLRSSGELNAFEKSFVVYHTTSINFTMRPLYIPKAWQACTWADARWMALRIARLRRADLERAFSECGWPPFVQKVAVERLLHRRNELVEAFRLEEDGIKPIPCDPDFDFAVTTKQGRDFPVRRGQIQADSRLVQELEATVHPEGLAEVISRKHD